MRPVQVIPLYKAIELTTNFILDQKINIIHQNPVETGIVTRTEDYLYSSAADLCRRKRIVKD
jgi:hypothetical protein